MGEPCIIQCTGWSTEDCPDEDQLKTLGDNMHDKAYAVSIWHSKQLFKDLQAGVLIIAQNREYRSSVQCFSLSTYSYIMHFQNSLERLLSEDRLHWKEKILWKLKSNNLQFARRP